MGRAGLEIAVGRSAKPFEQPVAADDDRDLFSHVGEDDLVEDALVEAYVAEFSDAEK